MTVMFRFDLLVTAINADKVIIHATDEYNQILGDLHFTLPISSRLFKSFLDYDLLLKGEKRPLFIEEMPDLGKSTLISMADESEAFIEDYNQNYGLSLHKGLYHHFDLDLNVGWINQLTNHSIQNKNYLVINNKVHPYGENDENEALYYFDTYISTIQQGYSRAGRFQTSQNTSLGRLLIKRLYKQYEKFSTVEPINFGNIDKIIKKKIEIDNIYHKIIESRNIIKIPNPEIDQMNYYMENIINAKFRKRSIYA